MDQITELGRKLAQEAGGCNQRRALVLAGDPSWCRQSAACVLDGSGLKLPLWITDFPPEGSWTLKGSRTHKVLGREVDAAVFDAHSGFDPDAFGAVTGSVRGGGLLLLLAPPLERWPEFDDPNHARIAVALYPSTDIRGRYLRRLAREVLESKDALLLEQGKEPPAPPQVKGRNRPEPVAGEACRTSDQQLAVEAIIRVLKGHRRRPLVLTSDRGRGKSAALGIAAARLLLHGVTRIMVTAPNLDAVEPLFEHAERLLPHAASTRGEIRLEGNSIKFASPDELTLSPRRADLLLVDEAAAIPAQLLERLLKLHSRAVFATTLHGYEGTGRGFALRFHKILDQRTPGWRELRMESPIRWAAGDPVERFVFRTLLLDADTWPEEKIAGIRPGECQLELLDRDRLAGDEELLSKLFGLLVLAHHRTRPSDLRNLLDGPNLTIHTARHEGQLVAAALVALEGGFDADTAKEVFAGRRRPRGHLIPLSLATHAGLEEAPKRRCARIVRIAVHPAAQRRGVGSRLISEIIKRAETDGIDAVGASFGATPDLLRFWSRLGFSPVRVGLTREHTSATHSVLLIRPLNAAGSELSNHAVKRFSEQFPYLLSDPLRRLEPEVGLALLLHSTGQSSNPRLDRYEWSGVTAFAFASHGYEANLQPIWKIVHATLTAPSALAEIDDAGRKLLLVRVIQKREWDETAEAVGLAGRTAVVEALRRTLRPLVLYWGGEFAREEAERLG